MFCRMKVFKRILVWCQSKHSNLSDKLFFFLEKKYCWKLKDVICKLCSVAVMLLFKWPALLSFSDRLAG